MNVFWENFWNVQNAMKNAAKPIRTRAKTAMKYLAGKGKKRRSFTRTF
jgi:hypothetical protein